jgi:PD-(D/E)XK nuclease superfamily
METRKLIKDAPHQKYITQEGEEVPGGSTICKIGDSPEPLIMWAWKLGMEGKDYRKERDRAADIGTLAHFMCEAFLNGFVCDLSDYQQEERDRALVCYSKFLDWWEEQELRVVATETQLVHPTLRFGGTIDLVARDKQGRLCLLDLKTSKRISDSYIRQIAGYTLLWDDNQPSEIKEIEGLGLKVRHLQNQIERWGIIRIGKQDEGDFEAVWYEEEQILACEETFQAQVKLYWAMQNEKAAKPKKPRGRKKKA